MSSNLLVLLFSPHFSTSHPFAIFLLLLSLSFSLLSTVYLLVSPFYLFHLFSCLLFILVLLFLWCDFFFLLLRDSLFSFCSLIFSLLSSPRHIFFLSYPYPILSYSYSYLILLLSYLTLILILFLSYSYPIFPIFSSFHPYFISFMLSFIILSSSFLAMFNSLSLIIVFVLFIVFFPA